jgi:hypothetical protein
MTISRSWRGGIAATILMCVAGCGAINEAENEPEKLGESQSLLLTDPTGLITVSINQCGPAGFPGGIGIVSCPVTPGYVLIGGGGGVVGEPVPGALLQASKPLGQAWYVQAKDHVHPSAYQLQAESIGLKLQGISQSALQAMVNVTVTNFGTPSHKPQSFLNITNTNLVLLSGGAAVHNLSGQQLLVASQPGFNTDGSTNGWFAISKDHEIPFLDTVDLYTITMPRCPPGFVGQCLNTRVNEFDSTDGTGYRPATGTATGPVSAVGAGAIYTSPGRLLTAMAIGTSGNQSTIQVDSKDHDLFDDGFTRGFYVSLFQVDSND